MAFATSIGLRFCYLQAAESCESVGHFVIMFNVSPVCEGAVFDDAVAMTELNSPSVISFLKIVFF